MISNKELRKKILESAIRGCLVKNNLELKCEKIDIEEPCNDLPFDIPNNWIWVKLKDIAKVISGTSYDKAHISDNGIRIIRGGNIVEDNFVVKDDDIFVPNEYYSDEKQLIENDIILVASTGSMDAIGKAAIIKENIDNAQIGAFLRIVRVKKEYSKYVGYIFMSDYYRNIIRDLVKGMAINNIKNGYLNEMLIPLPPLEEQYKIVGKLDELFKLIEKKEKNDKEKEKLKALLKEKLLDSAIKDNFETNLRNDKQYPFNIPNSWTWKSLNDISEKIVDGDHNPPKGENDFTDYFMLSAINICDNGLNEASNIRYLSKENFELSAKRTNVEKGDILLSIVGTIGKCCIYNSESNITFQRSVSVIKPSKIIYNKYLLYCLKTPFIQKYMNDNSAGAVQRGFYLKQLKELLIPVPPLEEQHRIVEKIEQCFELIEQL